MDNPNEVGGTNHTKDPIPYEGEGALPISSNEYIPINQEGQCIGICGEGAFGFVIGLKRFLNASGKPDENDPTENALKIPRLVADTYRENAFISEIMEQEGATAQAIYSSDTGNLAPYVPNSSAQFKYPISINLPIWSAWNDSILFVRYEKNQNPFFCLVKRPRGRNSELPIYPSGVRDFPDLDKNLWDSLCSKVKKDSKVIFLAGMGGGSKSKAYIHEADDVIKPSPNEKIWYACIPSATYKWAPITLQEVVARDMRKGKAPNSFWTTESHLKLIGNICEAIKTIHNRNYIHGDLRPANIVCLSDSVNREDDSANKPENYKVSDYGSLATAGLSAPLRASASTYQSAAGPSIITERVSPFYSPARGVAKERETADSAIVTRRDDDKGCDVFVGWKAKLKATGVIKADGQLDKDKLKALRGNAKSEGSNVLKSGDRIQIRDYIFELSKDETYVDGLQVFECAPEYWSIFHGRVLVKGDLVEDEAKQLSGTPKPEVGVEFNQPIVFSIPRLIEILQWSQHTDIFSIGVLTLYTLFFDSRNMTEIQRRGEDSIHTSPSLQTDPPSPTNPIKSEDSQESQVANTSNPAPHTSETVPPDPNNPELPVSPLSGQPVNTDIESSKIIKTLSGMDDEFREMASHFAQVPTFNAIWPRLEWIIKTIEDALSKNPQTDLRKEVFDPNGYPPTASKAKGEKPQSGNPLPPVSDDASTQEDGKEIISSVSQAATKTPEPQTGTTNSVKNSQPSHQGFSGESINLLLATREVVHHISASVPGIRELVHALDYNVGSFVFVLHFVLRCLHTADDMDPDNQKSNWVTKPFCNKRYDPQDGPQVGDSEDRKFICIDEVIARLKLIIKRNNSNSPISGLQLEKNDRVLPPYDLRSDIEIHGENTELKRDVADLTAENNRINELSQSDKHKATKLQDENERIRSAAQQAFDLLDKGLVNRVISGIPGSSVSEIKDLFKRMAKADTNSQTN